MCEEIHSIPPLFKVAVSAGTTVCSPTFTILEWPDASPPQLDGGGAVRCAYWDGNECTVGANDGGPEPCQYALPGIGERTPVTLGPFVVKVTEPGFTPVVVSNVFAGLGGCVNKPASSEAVTLAPLAGDAAADGS